MTEKAELTADYDELHQRWTKAHNIGSPIKFVRDSIIYKKLRKLTPGLTLEAGCGTGAYSFFLANNKHVVDAFDPSPIAIETLAQLSKGLPINYSLNTIENFSSTILYDNILCSEVLEHIQDDTKALAHLYSLLKPHGTILISVPATPFLYGSEDLRSGHIRRYTKSSMLKLLLNTGFRDVRIVSYGFPILFIYAILRKLLIFKNLTPIKKIKSCPTSPHLLISKFYSIFLFLDSLNIPLGSVGYVAICIK